MSAGSKVLLVREAGLAQMRMGIDQAGQENRARRIDDRARGSSGVAAEQRGDKAAQYAHLRGAVRFGIDHHCIGDQRVEDFSHAA